MTTIDISPEAVERLIAGFEEFCLNEGIRLECVSQERAALRALSAALTQSRAETAAAYEVAADSVRRLEDGWHDGVSAEYHQHSSAQMKLYAIREIRALATPEQTTALDAVKAEAWAQGMREAENRIKAAIEASGKLGRIIGFLGENEELIAAFREACGPELIARFHAATKGAKA